MKKDKEENKLAREEKNKRKKIDKSRLATQIIAGLMAILMILGICASFIYYILKII